MKSRSGSGSNVRCKVPIIARRNGSQAMLLIGSIGEGRAAGAIVCLLSTVEVHSA